MYQIVEGHNLTVSIKKCGAIEALFASNSGSFDAPYGKIHAITHLKALTACKWAWEWQ